ncbi:MAG: DNA polymerase domain-containing protein, partial [Candidatus Kariarchaeaceae archaeon]
RNKSESTFIQDLVRILDEVDPHVVVTYGGDKLLRILAKRATELGLGHLSFNKYKKIMPFSLNSRTSYIGSSFDSYGGHFYKDTAFNFRGGRHHFDLRNSFTWHDGGFAGIVELSRLSCMHPQQACRGSIGTLLTGMQILEAINTDILIPQRKADVERFRFASTLLDSDRGGFILSPQVGLHFNVLEIDFLSMFPTIMVNFNVSPETVNCRCCIPEFGFGLPVPGTNYHICQKRIGLVPRVLEEILRRRKFYKTRKKLSKRHDHLQKTLKWILVTCFGYLGYRNARWGRIDAHETINAFARDRILKVIQIAEKKGLEAPAGIVDSLWMKYPNERSIPQNLPDEICNEGMDVSELPISVEGIYKWIVFLPRLEEQDVGVLNRYYGVFTDGTMKIRGIEIRKRDVPEFIKIAQKEALKLLSTANNRFEFQDLLKSKYWNLLESWENRLLNKEINLDDLVISKTIAKNPNEYRQNNHQAIAANQLTKKGVHLQSGMKVKYLVTNSNSMNYENRVTALQKIDLNNYKEFIDWAWYNEKLQDAFENIVPNKLKKGKKIVSKRVESYIS